MNHNLPKTVLCEWTVRAHSFDRRVEAATAGGFDILPLSYRNYRRELAAGRRGEDLAAIAADQGILLDFLDGMTGWAPIRFPDGADDFLRQAMDFGPHEALDMCSAAGLRHIVAIAGFLPGALSHAELVDNFRSEEHTSELQSLMRISYAVFCLKKHKTNTNHEL